MLEIITNDGTGFSYEALGPLGNIQLDVSWVVEVSLSDDWLVYVLKALPYLEQRRAWHEVNDILPGGRKVLRISKPRLHQVFFGDDAKRIACVILEDFNKS